RAVRAGITQDPPRPDRTGGTARPADHALGPVTAPSPPGRRPAVPMSEHCGFEYIGAGTKTPMIATTVSSAHGLCRWHTERRLGAAWLRCRSRHVWGTDCPVMRAAGRWTGALIAA